MAKKSQPEKPVESQSETVESDSDSGGSEQNETQVKKATSKSAPELKSQPQSSSKMADEEESNSGSESESESDQNAKLVVSKPMVDPKKSIVAKKKGSKEHSTPVKSSGSKRPAEASKETTVNDKKRSKKKVDVQNQPSSSEAPKRALFERKWSEEEETVILNGMFDYFSKKNLDPAANVEILFDIIKKNLHVDATCVKLKEKIRKLKTKYLGHLSQELRGKLRSFPHAHQEISYELSKKIWGDQIENAVAVRKNKKSKIIKSVNDDVNRDYKKVKSVNCDPNLLVSKAVCSGSVEEMILRIGAEFFEGEKGAESEHEWKKIKNEEIENYLKKLDLMREKMRLVLDVLKSTDP